LDGLLFGDGLAECFALPGIVDGVFKGSLRQPDRDGANADASAVEGGECLVQASALLADQVPSGTRTSS
jgi:hypothetical protein